MDWLATWLQDIWDSFIVWGESLILTLWDMFKDALLFAFELVLEIVGLILEGMGTMFAAMDLTQYIDGIPPEVANVMGLIGLGQAVGLIITAIGIRIVLQLIPFTRLGS